MRDNPEHSPNPPHRPASSEYGDTLSDILKDQARRSELRKAPGPKPGRPRLHPYVPPILALISIWLWVFPPAVLRPDLPIIPLANQEAGLRMEMFIQVNHILRYVAENGRLPNDLAEVGASPVAVEYVPLGGNVFQLIGQTGDITVNFNSADPVEDLLGDAVAIVSGSVPSAGVGEPVI